MLCNLLFRSVIAGRVWKATESLKTLQNDRSQNEKKYGTLFERVMAAKLFALSKLTVVS